MSSIATQGQEWETAKLYGRIVARAWADASFKEQLQSTPEVVLRENGFDVPVGCEVRIEEGDRGYVRSGDIIYVSLPAQPGEEFGIEPLSLRSRVGVLTAGACICGPCTGPETCTGPFTEPGLCTGPNSTGSFAPPDPPGPTS